MNTAESFVLVASRATETFSAHMSGAELQNVIPVAIAAGANIVWTLDTPSEQFPTNADISEALKSYAAFEGHPSLWEFRRENDGAALALEREISAFFDTAPDGAQREIRLERGIVVLMADSPRCTISYGGFGWADTSEIIVERWTMRQRAAKYARRIARLLA